jgi:GGDEF domain-containing protein
LLAVWAWPGWVRADEAPAARAAFELHDGQRVSELRQHGVWWLGPSGNTDAALRELLALEHTPAAQRPPFDAAAPLRLKPGQSLWGWVRIDFAPDAPSAAWRLRFENPTLDFLALYATEDSRSWQRSLAGDRAAGELSLSPTLSAFPEVDSRLPGLRQGWLIEIRHNTGALAGALALVDVDTVASEQIISGLVIGVLSGAALILCALAAVDAFKLRSGAMALGSVFYLGVAASLAVHMGAVNLLELWTPAALAHGARYVAPLMLMLVWTGLYQLMLRTRERAPGLHRLLLAWGGVLLLVTVGLVWQGFMGREPILVLQASLTITVLVNLGGCLWLHRRYGDQLALGAAAAMVWAFLGSLITSGTLSGWFPGGAWAWYAYPVAVLTAAIGLFLLQDRAERRQDAARLRARQLASTDALTGLPNEVSVARSFAGMMMRNRHFNQVSGLAVIRVLNEPEFRRDGGHRLARFALVNLAARLSQAVRPVDVLATSDSGDYVLLCEGPMSAEELKLQATRCLSAALREPIGGITPRLGLALALVPPGRDALGPWLDAATQALDALEPGSRAIVWFDAPGDGEISSTGYSALATA